MKFLKSRTGWIFVATLLLVWIYGITFLQDCDDYYCSVSEYVNVFTLFTYIVSGPVAFTFPFTNTYENNGWVMLSSFLINFVLFYLMGFWAGKFIGRRIASKPEHTSNLKKARTLHRDTLRFYFSHIAFLFFIVAALVGLNVVSRHILSYKSYGGLVAYLAITIKFLSYFARLFVVFLLLEYVSGASAGESFKKASHYYVSYMWLSFFLYILGFGGLIAFIIPGALIIGWASVAVYVFISEQKQGIQAFYRSKELVLGRWWGVAWRWICLFVPILLIGLSIVGFSGKGFIPNNLYGEIAVNAVLVLLTPYIFIYGRFLYESLVSTYEVPVTFKKEKKIPYIILAVLGLIATIPVVAISVLNISAIDEQLPYDQDLIPPKIAEVPKDQNLFYDLAFPFPQKEGDIPKVIGETSTTIDIATGKTWDKAVAQKFIADNGKLFEWMDKEFTKKIYYQDPSYLDPLTLNPYRVLPALNTLRIVARAESIRAEYLFQEGKEQEAMEESIKIIRLGDMVIRSQGSLLEYLVGIMVKDLGYRRLRLIVDRSSLTSDMLKKYVSRLEQFKEYHDGLRNSFKFQYLGDKWFIKNFNEILGKEYFDNTSILDRVAYKGSFYYKTNKTLRLFGDIARRRVANVDLPCMKRVAEPDRELYDTASPQGIVKILFTENAISKIMASFAYSSFDSVFNKACSLDFSSQSSEILLAMKIYVLENKTPPATLNDLTGIISESTLKDPFDGNQIRYSKDKKIIYTVGSDGVDGGGSDESDWSKSPDPAVKFSF